MDNYSYLYRNSAKVDRALQKVFKMKIPDNLPTSQQMFEIMKPEKQKMFIDNDLVLFYGNFGWAFGHKSGAGTATCISLNDIKETILLDCGAIKRKE